MLTKKKVFSGCATAIITPFKDEKIDFDSFCSLIEEQVSAGVNALVVLGTTGESPTVEASERETIIKTARQAIRGRVPLIVGTGSNNTKNAVNLTQGAEFLGADAILSVTPYYNKATEHSLALHYKEIAKSTTLPIILYNVPSRTGTRLTLNTLKELRDVENIVAIKEASGDVSELEGKLSALKDYFWFYSGCDELILPTYSLGGVGVISAVANVIPREIATLCALFEQGHIERATELALELSPLIKELFAEVNPIPVKGALSLMKKCENTLRLPLAPSSRLDKIEALLKSYSLI